MNKTKWMVGILCFSAIALFWGAAFFILFSGLNAQQVIENSDKPLSKNADRVLPLQPAFGITAQKAAWKGKIETENGIRLINNPKEPLLGQIKLDLQEDLSIGSEDDKNYMFYRVRGIAVDNQGNIYVADMSNFRVQKFNRNGKYLMTIGRKGQGPGEFEQPTKILIDESKGNIYVQDQMRIKVFDKEGKYATDIIPNKYAFDFIVAGNGSIAAKLSSTTESGESARDFAKINSKGEILKTYASFPFYFIIQGKSGTSTVVAFSGLEHDLCIAAVDDQAFLYGFSKEYELNVTDGEGKIVFIIRKDEPYHNFPSSVSNKLRKNQFFYKIPPHMPFFYSILTDNEKRIYVQTNKTEHEPEVKGEVDVFSKDGYYLYKTIIPHGTYIIKNGYLYVHVVDEDKAMEYVKRYRIKNWEQIKKGI
jgi:hypothetical protein